MGLEILEALRAGGMKTEGTKCHFFTFQSEEEALDHAAKITTLKPGDLVYWRMQDKRPVAGVFTGHNGGKLELLSYDPSTKIIRSGNHPICCLMFPNQITDEMMACPFPTQFFED